MQPFDYKELFLRLLPEAILAAGALIALFLDQARARVTPATARSFIATAIAAATLAGALLAVPNAAEGHFYGGMLVITPLAKIVRICILLLALGTILISRSSRFTEHIGEFTALLLLASIGLILLAATEELLTAFIALELTSLSLYLLTAFNKQSIHSAEAALKYFLFGSVAAAFTLFGISLLFGLAGSTSFSGIAAGLRSAQLSPLLIVAMVLVALGFGFKMAAAPMHLWAPDAYQGAPVPSAAFIASGSKLASFILFLKLFVLALPHQAGSATFHASTRGWMIVIAAIAAASMIFGNLLAIVQSNLRRLIAYSAVAHAGYVLVAVLAGNENGAAAAIYYLFTYGLAVVGTFAVIGFIEARHGEITLADLAGLSRRSPGLALCLFVFILSLAGIPPLAGFFGKFYVFLAALDATRIEGAAPGLLWLVVVALMTSAVSLYYYLQVLKQAFVATSESGERISVPFLQFLPVLLLAGSVVYLGCFPNRLAGPLSAAAAKPPQNPPASTSANSPHVLAEVK